MKKHTKFIAVLSAAAFMAFGGAFASMASTGWVEENGTWMYYDSEGYQVTDSWKKLDNSWYYLDSDGAMATEQKIDDYYVGEDGLMVTNEWVKIAGESDYDSPDTPDSNWYYFDKDGKMLKGKWKEVGKDWHYFNDEGHMQTGKFTLGSDTYYTGDTNDGAMKTGWVKLEDTSSTPDVKEAWHYFETSGKMVADQVDKKIDGHYYTFKDGKMQTDWVKTNESTDGTEIDSYKYYGNSDDGKRSSGWNKIEGISGISEAGKEHWFFFKNGKAVHSTKGLQTITVDSKKYCFNTSGEAQFGLQVVNISSDSIANYYFGKDGDGVMKTGKQSIYDEDTDETKTWFFHTDGEKKGQGYHGLKDSSIYFYGLRQDADADVRFAPVHYNTNDFLVNTSGLIQKAISSSKSAVKPELGAGYKDFKDNNGVNYVVDINGIIQK